MKLELNTERFCLHPLQLDDIDLTMEMFTDPDVLHYICDVLTKEEIEAGDGQ